MKVYCITEVNGHLCKSVRNGSLAIFDEYRNADIEMQRIVVSLDIPIQISKGVLMSKEEHDRLTSENAQLREALESCISALGSCYEVSNIGVYASDQGKALNKSKQLLTELEKGDE